MRTLKLHLVRAQNILCFGPGGIELHFADLGNVVQVRGINLDYPHSASDPHASCNATGKSSIQEILSIGLFGRTVKSPTKNKGDQIVNCLAEKGEVEVQWDDYRLVRSFRRLKDGGIKGKLQLWKSASRIWDATSAVDLPLGGLEREIERAVGLSHHAFCNVVVFDDSNTYSFLEADAPKKREIVENLLDLDQYRDYLQNAKDAAKGLKQTADRLSREYSLLQDGVAEATGRLGSLRVKQAEWRAAKDRQIAQLEARIAEKQAALGGTESGRQLANWQTAQDRAARLAADNVDLESKRQRITDAVAAAQAKVDAIREDRDAAAASVQDGQLSLRTIKAQLQQAVDLAGKLEGMEDGATCPYCYGTISRENYGPTLDHARQTADECKHRLAEQSAECDRGRQTYEQKRATLAGMEEKIREAHGKVAVIEASLRKNRQEISQLSSLPKPEGRAAEQVLEVEIVEFRRQLAAAREECGRCPYDEIVTQGAAEVLAKEDACREKAAALDATSEELPYYEFWVEAFGDDGIRKSVIDGIIPALNENVAYWMQILIDGRLSVTFDNALDAAVTRVGNRAHYSSVSNGEKRRINLAVSQAFAYIMMLDCGSCPSVVFLDEVTGGGIDRAGVAGVYNMISELAKDRQVFVTTHNENLMSLLQGCGSITLQKENDLSVLLS